jgi:hypothetical protein
MIGRLPNRSDKTPSKGEKKNCISAKTTANRALHFAASVISPPRKSRINFGRTGMIKPIARMSRVTVTRMKIIAAGRDFMTVEHERNVVAAFVSTAATALTAASASTTNLLGMGSPLLPFAGNGGRKRIKVDRLESPAVASHPLRLRRRYWQSPKAQISGGQAACQRVEDNAFHLGYFAR